MYRVRLCHCFQAFPCPGLIHGAETNKLAAVLFFLATELGKQRCCCILFWQPNTPIQTTHLAAQLLLSMLSLGKKDPYEGILCAVAFPWPLSDHSSHRALDIYFFALSNSRGVGEGWTSLSRMDKLKSGWGGGYARPVQNPPAGPCQNIPALASCLRLQ